MPQLIHDPPIISFSLFRISGLGSLFPSARKLSCLGLSARVFHDVKRELKWQLLIRPDIIIQRDGRHHRFKVKVIERIFELAEEASDAFGFYMRFPASERLDLDFLLVA